MPAEHEVDAERGHDEDFEHRGEEALLRDRIAIGEDRLGGVRPDLHSEHLLTGRVRHRVVVRHGGDRVRADEDRAPGDEPARYEPVDDVLQRHDAELTFMRARRRLRRGGGRGRRRVVDGHAAPAVDRHGAVPGVRRKDESVALDARSREVAAQVLRRRDERQPVVALTVGALDDELAGLWDAPVKTAGLRWGM